MSRSITAVIQLSIVFLFGIAAPGRAQLVYVTGAANILANRVDSRGALTRLQYTQIATGLNPSSVSVHPKLNVLYWAVGPALRAMRIAEDGSLTIPPGVETVRSPVSQAVDPTGRFLYVGNEEAAGGIQAYAIDSAGMLTRIGSPAPTPTFAATYKALAVSPDGRFVYFSGTQCNCIAVYSIGPGGALTQEGVPVATPIGPGGIEVDPAGRFLFVPTRIDVSTYSIGPTGTLTRISSTPGTGSSIVVAPDGRFAYLAALGIVTYSIGANGALTLAADTGTGPFSPTAMAVDPSGRFVYATFAAADQLRSFEVTPSGALTPISSILSLHVPDGIAVISRCSSPPRIDGAAAQPNVLWPPNGKFVPVELSYIAASSCGKPACSLEVSSNEPSRPAPNGEADWAILGPHNLLLRAKREGGGKGRVYTVKITCRTDEISASKELTVVVPHDHGK